MKFKDMKFKNAIDVTLAKIKSRKASFKKMDKGKKLATMIIITTAIAGSTYYLRKDSNKNEQIQQMSVTVDPVRIDSVNIKANFVGKIRTSESITLISEIVGRIVYQKPDGSQVRKGEIILELDSTEAEGKYMSALGRKNEEEVKLKTAELMFAEGYRTQTHIAEQKAKYQSAQGQLLEAKAHLEKHKIKAPFNGIIGLHTQGFGATVTQHLKLVSVTNLENLQAEFLISETELRNLGGIDKIKDAKIFVTLDGHLLPIQAYFSAYETIIDAETNAIAVRATLAQEPGLVATPGQLAHVLVNIGKKENVLTISENALENSHGIYYVFKIINGLAIKVAVKPGIRDENKVEILEGLSEGDIVVTSGLHRLYDGQNVKIEEEGKE